jgi:hypothetical protein
LAVGIDEKSGAVQPFQGFPLGLGIVGIFGEVQGVGEKLQAALGDDLGIQLAQGTGGGVAGVGKIGLSCLFSLSIQAFKFFEGQESFAANFYYWRY